MNGARAFSPPGSLVHVSHLPSPSPIPPLPTRPLRLVQWNVERCYQMDAILSQLDLIDADVLCLQEIDIGCKRSACVDGMESIAKRLGMEGWGVVEFWELDSDMRPRNNQGGGIHLNAVFSRVPLRNARAIEHRYSAINWDTDGHKFKEPRRGRRYAVAAEIEWAGVSVCVWSVHLEVFGGLSHRMLQLADILADSSSQLSRSQTHVVAGDFNTVAHGVARLSPKYCQDSNRFLTIGSSEPQLWHDHIFSSLTSTFPPSSPTAAASFIPSSTLSSRLPPPSNYPSLLPANDASTFDPLPYLSNPSHLIPCLPPSTTTLFNPLEFNFFAALDQILVRGCRVTHRRVGNAGYDASDHKWVLVHITPDQAAVAREWRVMEDPASGALTTVPVAVDATGAPLIQDYAAPQDAILAPLLPAHPYPRHSFLRRALTTMLVLATPWTSLWYRELKRERWSYYEVAGGSVRMRTPWGAVGLLAGVVGGGVVGLVGGWRRWNKGRAGEV
ncbi:hypothetical protein M427DRAFT_156005 [Gonapodya prolifera JEL478]|uniref:Endonuclease/exonuclease/phosphatase domain-containing protein n=1 Tax=Gonapodya prolifera (strain JEL478) TaxID=1344416 RepID=A0A139ADJ7_GONPJ|nr:hypothetical protein M427DRAFT_156005 [Gonapodya prolifera JEL478]|eukprot:KXS14493.1 hypothetical protein M427DRAFT_156005 [Gonapodya prolifera JEL478]